MNIDVAFTPSEVQALSNKVCVVVDVIRATSSLTVIMSQKPSKVVLATTIQKATRHASQQTVHPLLCGERKGVAPEGFDYGNSPSEFSKASLKNKSIVFTSSNGTRAIADIVIAPTILLGCILNATAVAQKAFDEATAKTMDILFVCAGREEKFAIDDAYCAGLLVSKLLAFIPASSEFKLGDGAQAALSIYGHCQDRRRLLEMSAAGTTVKNLGHHQDIYYLMQEDLFEIVPQLIKDGNAPIEHGFSLLG